MVVFIIVILLFHIIISSSTSSSSFSHHHHNCHPHQSSPTTSSSSGTIATTPPPSPHQQQSSALLLFVCSVSNDSGTPGVYALPDKPASAVRSPKQAVKSTLRAFHILLAEHFTNATMILGIRSTAQQGCSRRFPLRPPKMLLLLQRLLRLPTR